MHQLLIPRIVAVVFISISLFHCSTALDGDDASLVSSSTDVSDCSYDFISYSHLLGDVISSSDEMSSELSFDEAYSSNAFENEELSSSLVLLSSSSEMVSSSAVSSSIGPSSSSLVVLSSSSEMVSSSEPVMVSMVPPRSFVADQPGNIKNQVRAQHRAFDQTPLQSTGYYVLAGDVITASYSYTGSEPTVTPQVLIHDISNENALYTNEEFVTLSQEGTTVTAAYDGIVYFCLFNEPTDGEITLNLESGGRIMPRFVYNYHRNEHLDTMMVEHAEAPWVELVGNSAMVTATMGSSVTHIDDPTHLMALYDTIIAAGQEQYGISEGKAYPHDPVKHKFHFVEIAPTSSYYMFSWFYRMTAKHTAIENYLNAEYMRTKAWGMWHEFGHQLQMKTWTWEDQVEVTVNITSAYIEQLLGNDSRFEKDGHYETVFNYFNQGSKNYQDLELFPRAIMFWQLRLTFGDPFYKTMGMNYRNYGLGPWDYSESEKKQQFIIEASRVAGYDLTPFFEQWGIPVEWATKATLAGMSLKVLSDPIWQNRDTNILYVL
ncbi:MAG: M60 family metallopeptidase [Fibrobacterales bacterium]